MYKKIFFISFFLFILPIASYPNSSGFVTALSWWNYLDKDWVKSSVKDTCNIDLAVQSYKDANEFSKSFELKYYDIGIYESSQFKEVESETLNKFNSHKRIKKEKYHPEIEKFYNEFINNPSTALFFLSNTVFLYNPSNVNISDSDTIKTILSKLKSKKHLHPLIILDDPVIINTMVEQEAQTPMTTELFTKLFDYNNLVISNDFIDYKDLGIFFTWSGEAVYHKELAKKKGINLEIQTIPLYSYITADLISVLSESKEASCVANLFSSKLFLQKLQEDTYYYSPFANHEQIKNLSHLKLYKDFYKILNEKKAKWIFPSREQLINASRAWEKVILDYGL
jgi:hypothetical protein